MCVMWVCFFHVVVYVFCGVCMFLWMFLRFVFFLLTCGFSARVVSGLNRVRARGTTFSSRWVCVVLCVCVCVCFFFVSFVLLLGGFLCCCFVFVRSLTCASYGCLGVVTGRFWCCWCFVFALVCRFVLCTLFCGFGVFRVSFCVFVYF